MLNSGRRIELVAGPREHNVLDWGYDGIGPRTLRTLDARGIAQQRRAGCARAVEGLLNRRLLGRLPGKGFFALLVLLVCFTTERQFRGKGNGAGATATPGPTASTFSREHSKKEGKKEHGAPHSREDARGIKTAPVAGVVTVGRSIHWRAGNWGLYRHPAGPEETCFLLIKLIWSTASPFVHAPFRHNH